MCRLPFWFSSSIYIGDDECLRNWLVRCLHIDYWRVSSFSVFFHIADYFRGTALDSQIEYIDLEFIMYSYKAGSVYCWDEASFLSNSIRLYTYCLGCYLCLTSRKKITDAAQSPKRCLALVLKANPKEREVMKSRLDSRWWMGSSIWLPDVTLAFFFYYVGVLSRRFDWQRPSSNPISVGQRDSRTGTNLSLSLSLEFSKNNGPSLAQITL